MSAAKLNILSLTSSYPDSRAQHARWNVLKLLGWGFIATAALGACADEPAAKIQADRKPIGKADANLGSCEHTCGGQSKKECWCDDACAEIGDCCSDYATFCAAPVADPAALCEATGGVWEGKEDGCECRQDAAAAAMNYHFDAIEGCIAGTPIANDAVALCDNTGGAWEDGACQCQQDGASMNLEYWFDAEKGCVPGGSASLDDSALVYAIVNKGAQTLLTEFGPAEGDGVYIIERPGVIDVPTYFKDYGAALERLNSAGYPELFAETGACDAGLDTESLPVVDCENEPLPGAGGCHLLAVMGDESVSYLMETHNIYGFEDFTEAQIELAMQRGERVRRTFVDARTGIRLAFHLKDGAWHLVVIHLSSLDCSA